ncbi:MAG: glycosyltransferase family 4 protein [Lacunisphaera sp.]
MKIAYVYHDDAADPSVQSGHPEAVLTELLRLGHEVERIFPLSVPFAGTEFAKQVGYRILGRHHRPDRNLVYLDALAAQFAARIKGRAFDLIVSPGSEVISQLQTSIPIAYCADATFSNLVDYYWDFTDLSAEYRRQGHEQETAALARAMLAVFPSEWAARAAIERHGADPAAVAVIPFGANLGRDNPREEVFAWIDRRPAAPIRLLFVGRHWARKGGDLVIATALCLSAHGHPVTVDIVGCDVPAEYRNLPVIRAHGLLHQRNPEHMIALCRLYREAHFLFVPSRAEAYGFTFTEANAFGVPPVATATGGIPSIIRHGHNGILRPIGALPSDYADAIVSVFSDRARYREMARRAFTEFEERLNWNVFTRKFLELAGERIAARTRPAA